MRSIDLLARDENRHSDTNGMHHARPSLEMDRTLNFDGYRLGPKGCELFLNYQKSWQVVISINDMR